MIIIDNRDNAKLENFGDISIGDCFTLEQQKDHPLLKIVQIYEINAVSLISGSGFSFKMTDIVICLNASVHMKD